MILEIGQKTVWGKIAGILFIGERYYLIEKKGLVSLIPATELENENRL